ncbi:MAG: glycosyltransferase [Patescibacteria group bacterium]|nr:glycosyltransferase [Patescibacteria group bacterium]
MVKVSIISPFYNGSKFIGECVRNVHSQSFDDFEYIIVNDGSNARETAFLKNMISGFGRASIISRNNGGQAAAVDDGVRNTNGKYVAFCDQDDWWLPGKLVKQVEYLDNHKDIDLVYSDAYIGDENGNISDKTWMQTRRVTSCVGGYNECVVELFKRNFICAPLVVTIRKSALDAVGGINRKYTSAYDYDLWFRLLEHGSRFGYINEPLAVWRSHSQNESGNIRRAKKNQFLILTAFLKRNSKFIIKHPVLILSKYMRMFLGGLIKFNPYNI